MAGRKNVEGRLPRKRSYTGHSMGDLGLVGSRGEPEGMGSSESLCLCVPVREKCR